jgi:vacuolar protein sorting-associated protein 16
LITEIVEGLIKLLQVHSKLERELNHSFTDLTVTESILKCFSIDQVSRASKFKSDFKLSEKK